MSLPIKFQCINQAERLEQRPTHSESLMVAVPITFVIVTAEEHQTGSQGTWGPGTCGRERECGFWGQMELGPSPLWPVPAVSPVG